MQMPHIMAGWTETNQIGDLAIVSVAIDMVNKQNARFSVVPAVGAFSRKNLVAVALVASRTPLFKLVSNTARSVAWPRR